MDDRYRPNLDERARSSAIGKQIGKLSRMITIILRTENEAVEKTVLTRTKPLEMRYVISVSIAT